ncbi:MAG: alginate lyase family protein [Candidatus Rifleibacteriota bacterium]
MDLVRLFNTLKYLKPVQIYGRFNFLLQRKLAFAKRLREEPQAAKELKKLYKLKDCNHFDLCFLNDSRTLSIDNVGWKAADWPFDERPCKLWLYNLNYFNWLFSENPEHSKELKLYLILDWIEKNDCPGLETWEPYPVSKRLTNWVAWLEQYKELVGPIKDCINLSIYHQCERLVIDIEYHIQANHLFENLKAILVTSLYLLNANMPKPFKLAGWARKAASELIEQINEQFCNDGGHYERSPMYHKEMLKAVEDVKNCIQNIKKSKFLAIYKDFETVLGELEKLCLEKLPVMQDWLKNMTHPDGQIALFNDCALSEGIKPEINASGKPTNYLLENSGFFIRRWKKNYFVASCKEPSPSYQPGHSHCDIMSYELSIKGIRCIVDTGCGSYQDSEIRHHCRSTASHNLPLIELTEQSDIWGSFRIGKRAQIINRSFDSQTGLLMIEMIDQYGQRFKREVVFTENSVKIRDRMFERRITGTFCSLIHLHPDALLASSPGSISIDFSIRDVEFSIQTNAKVRTESHIWYPGFGKAVPSQKLILCNHETEAIDYVISWKP